MELSKTALEEYTMTLIMHGIALPLNQQHVVLGPRFARAGALSSDFFLQISRNGRRGTVSFLYSLSYIQRPAGVFARTRPAEGGRFCPTPV